MSEHIVSWLLFLAMLGLFYLAGQGLAFLYRILKSILLGGK